MTTIGEEWGGAMLTVRSDGSRHWRTNDEWPRRTVFDVTCFSEETFPWVHADNLGHVSITLANGFAVYSIGKVWPNGAVGLILISGVDYGLPHDGEA